MSHNKQDIVRQPPVAPPPKPQKDHNQQKHWSQRIQETVVSALPEGEFGIHLKGGADNGQFCYISELKLSQLTFHNGKLYVDDIILEIQGQKIAGYTLRDATIWLKQVGQNGAPIMVKTVKIGLLPRDLKQYLAARFQKGSVDHDLQQTIRDNLYLRTVPCTTRKPRPKEKNGVDYTFLSMEEFLHLEKEGKLLESGVYGGNHYGTPKPPHEPKGPLLRRTGSVGQVADKRKRTRSIGDPGSAKSSPIPFHEEISRKKSLERAHSSTDLGPLPPNWEMAYTDDGHPYFIDHDTETTHWLDPRLSHLQKQTAMDCNDDELPFGWEKVEDPHYGTYYIDHVNRRTQYENPVAQAKRTQGNDLNSTLPRTKKSQDSAKRSTSDSNMMNHHRGAPPDYSQHGKALRGRKDPKRVFTKIPDELKGQIVNTSLVKSIRGFGFTIIGGDHSDQEFLQIKKVVENGPAYLDGVLQTGDVLVYVDDKCVLGYSHQDIVNLFQTIEPLQRVSLSVCRGYSLPFDPDDPNTEIIVTVAVSLPSGDSPFVLAPPSYAFHQENHPNSGMNFTSANNPKSLPDLTRSVKSNSDNSLHGSGGGGSIRNDNAPDVLDSSSSKVETLTMHIVRGEMGFGFTIADSAFGQRVKQILDKPRCKDLQESDILQEINSVNVKNMSHSQIVQVLKECPKGVETKIVIQRGGVPLRSRKPSNQGTKSEGNTSDTSFSSNPGAFFFNEDKQTSGHNRFMNGGIDSNKENHDMIDGSKPAIPSRPKTPNQSDSRPKTPTDRPKTPTRTLIEDHGKPPLGNRHMEMFSTHNDLRRDNDEIRDLGSQGQDLNQSRSSSEFYDINTRPPPGPRYDQYRNEQRTFRPDTFSRSNSAAQFNSHDREREVTKPGMFRSRTPGPDMLHRGHGPDYRGDHQRPKTPTAQDMRSKTPLPGSSYNYSDRGGYQNNTFGMNGPSRQGFGQQRQWGFNNYPGSPPTVRRGGDDYQDPYKNNFSTFSQKGAGHPSRQSTSFEDVNPTPSNLTRVPKRLPLQSNSSFNSQYSSSPRLPPRMSNREEAVRVAEYSVTLSRQDSGFGFRIIGGTEEGSQVSVGHIVPGGAADLDTRIRTGDEITHVDGISVLNSTHQRVVLLMTNAGTTGRVTLGLRRRILVSGETSYNGMSEVYDITVNRRETEGFGFVIISSVTKSGSVIGEFIDGVSDWLDRINLYPWIGRILENSPAERCGRLHVGDRILAVNGVDISCMHHEEIVNLIKEAGYSVTLTIGIPQDDASSTTSNSQKGSQGSMVNAMAYPTSNDTNMRRYPPPPLPGDRMKEINRQRSVSNHQHSDEEEYLVVELQRGSRGFGFSIRGGTEFNSMPLFVLRIAEDGSADMDGRLRVGDQILEINGFRTDNMSHSDAIDVIQNGGTNVRLLIKRTGKLPPSFENNPVSNRYGPSVTAPMSNGPIGQSSPYLGRRTFDPRDEQQFYNYNRQYNY
ncbi:membrane-associated guanylate kinase, WW and PDZ domain-containing protein 2-like isoform X2 [Mytilus californianus]|uniref:membrane-associated guanylate kinase, WW and PDZ domain-containing protein 2-like isoform X2 n=1 Tax=Mytilus californianus TaxID=6549 RepID=UPI00224752BD|nr:membrane-associated guanylate kinase, WW and PDZ domain-containing protein 2-like isoform X2 [Mytilus californianus]